MKQLFLLAFFVHSSLCTTAQRTFFIRDGLNSESVPFVKVYPNNGTPFLADIDGVFKVGDEVNSVELKVSGYKDTLVDLLQVENSIIQIRPVVQEIKEVIATAGENPAHRIMDLVIANRKKNHPRENDAFQYNSYSKFIFDIDREYLTTIPDSTTDSTLIQIREFFNEQHLFILESSSTRTFIPTSRDKEVINAYKVSGFTDPMFSTFANELQSFSFYENQVQLMGKSYVNPIAFGGTNRYLFILQDTTVTARDTTFTIFYRPRKGKNFDGLTGHLFINTNNYAIEKVIASPYLDTAGFSLKIIQEYAFTNNKKWFPVKLSTELAMPATVSVEGLQIIGKGSTYIRDVTFDREKIDKVYFDNVSVVVDENADAAKKEQWDSVRAYKLTAQEERTYEMIDSLSEATGIGRKLSALKVLSEGKLPIGPVNLDLYRLINFNQFEGYRLGLGLETSSRLMKPVSFGGYFGYGTKDKYWKYGGNLTFHLYRPMGVRLDFRYQDDLVERGGTGFGKGGFSLSGTELYRNFFITWMERQRLAEASLSAYVKGNIRLSLTGNFQRVWFENDYVFFTTDGIQPSVRQCDVAEVSAELMWNIREEVMMVGDQRISKGTVFPKIRLRAAQGLPGIYTSQYDYLRLNLEVEQSFPILMLGKFNWKLTAGETIGDVPLFLHQVADGTGRKGNLSVANTFETVVPGEFFHSRQAALFTRMNFTPIKTKAKWNEPQICLHHAIGFGEMENRQFHSMAFNTMDKGFSETGLILNNLFASGISGIGVGIFYRYGYYSFENWLDNIMPKVSLSVKL
jgi:hypothetical protein